MAWSWSHTNEAYRDAEARLRLLDREELLVIYAEWNAISRNDHDSFSEYKYKCALHRARRSLTNEELADVIWEKMSDNAVCDNGGHTAWCCPSGCHTVRFDPPEECELDELPDLGPEPTELDFEFVEIGGEG